MKRKRLKLTAGMIPMVLEMSQAGMSKSGMAAQLGVMPHTFMAWLDDERHSGAEHVDALRRAYAEGRSRLEQEMLKTIRAEISEGSSSSEIHVRKLPNGDVVTTTIERKTSRSAQDAWRMLERRFPEEYGRKAQLEHSGGISGDGIDVSVNLIFDDGEGEREREEGEG